MLWKTARQHDQERDRLLSHRLGVLAGRRRHCDVTMGSRGHVDVDRPAARAADEAQRIRRVEHCVGHRRAVDHEYLDPIHPRQNLVRRSLELADRQFGLGARLEQQVWVELEVID